VVRVAKAAAPDVPEGAKKPRKTAEGGKAPPCFVEEHGICWVSTNRDGNGSRATRVCIPAGYGNVVCMSTLNSKAVLEPDHQITANLGLAELSVFVNEPIQFDVVGKAWGRWSDSDPKKFVVFQLHAFNDKGGVVKSPLFFIFKSVLDDKLKGKGYIALSLYCQTLAGENA
jgi:hypothetical protein